MRRNDGRNRSERPSWYEGLKRAPYPGGRFGDGSRRAVLERLREGKDRSGRARGTAAAVVAAGALMVMLVFAGTAGPIKTPLIDSGKERETRNLFAVQNVKLLEAFPGGNYTAGAEAGCWWNVYEPYGKVKDRTIRIEAIHRSSGYTMAELAETKLSEVGREYDNFTRVPTRFALPLAGVWTFTVYLDGERFGDVVFDVPDYPWNVSETFRSGAYELRGVPNRLGFIDPGFKAGKPNKYMWHFWGKPESLQGELSIVAVKKGSERLVRLFEAPSLGGPLNGADAAIPAGLTLPEPGMWRLMAFVDGRLHGSVVVETADTSDTEEKEGGTQRR